jgi:hypothetical protein
MRTSTRVTIALSLVTVIILVAGTAAIASNAGFKMNRDFFFIGQGSPNVARNWVSLPYFNPYGTQGSVARTINGSTQNYPNFQGLCDAIGMANLAGSITELDPELGTFCQYVCGGGNQCPMIPGKGGEMRDPSLTDFILVGSHDPSLQLTIPSSAPGGQVGAFWFAVPYHSTWNNYQDICVGIGLSQLPAASNPGSVIGLDASTGTFTFQHACGSGGSGSPLILGEFVQVRNDVDITFTPAHF